MLAPVEAAAPTTRFDVLLADGSTAQVRPISPSDGPGIVALYNRVSPHSIVLRYFGPRRPLSEDELARVTTPDGVDVVVLVAQRHDDIVAMAEYHRDAGHDEAEVAFLVEDALQGHGLGTILLEHLADVARRHGIRRFIADTLAENRRMLGVFGDAGFVRQFSRNAEVVRVVLDIEPSPGAMAAADARDHVAVVQSMKRVLEPRSVAVVGAGRRPGTIGHELLRNILAGGFNGPVYPVNSSADHVASVPAWASVSAVPGPVDLAVVAVPEEAVATVVEDCGTKGVAALVVITSGFAESGSAGGGAQAALVSLSHRHGMRMVGPNCFGVINTDPRVSLNATFAAHSPRPGTVGFASQSGGLGIAILAEADARGLGLSSFVSMGNKADVSGNDLLQWWEDDPATDVVLLYLESFGNPRKFSRIARRLSRSKPVIVVKGGTSRAGTRAASSHTAALASSDTAVDALFEQTGVIRVETIEELFDVAELCAHQPLPAGPRVAVVGNAGGPGVLAADACAGRGLEVPELSPGLHDAMRTLLPGAASVGNPVDLAAGATAQSYYDALTTVLGSGEVDAAVVIFTPPLVTRALDVAESVRAAVEALASTGHEPTVVASFLGGRSVRDTFAATPHPVPCFAYPENAVRALGHVVRYAQWRARPDPPAPTLGGLSANEARRRVAEASGDRSTWITGAAAGAVLEAYGIPVLPTGQADGADAAVEVARDLGFPVVLKAWGPDIVHKTERGGVRLGLADADAVAGSYREMAATMGDAMRGAVVQPMVAGGVETIAGFVQDPAFGPLVVFGLGGTAVEVLGDAVTRLAPLTEADARAMVLGLRGSQLLLGYRGSPAVDIDALVDVVLRMSKLAEDLPEIAEADCNPLMASSTGVAVADARLRVGPEGVRTSDIARHLR